nr:hypothetical protein [Burkholderia territorii]
MRELHLQPVAGERQRHAVGRCERDAAAPAANGAAVLDARADQRDRFLGVDPPFVDDLGVRIAGEVEAACEEVVIRHVQRRSDQAADVDLRLAADQDAVGVHDEHAARCVQRAENLRRVGPDDPVQHGGGLARLYEVQRLVRRNVHVAPVDHHLVGLLVDGGDGAVGDDRAAAVDDHMVTDSERLLRGQQRRCQHDGAKREAA